MEATWTDGRQLWLVWLQKYLVRRVKEERKEGTKKGAMMVIGVGTGANACNVALQWGGESGAMRIVGGQKAEASGGERRRAQARFALCAFTNAFV